MTSGGIVDLDQADFERFESFAQKPLEPLTEQMNVRITSSLHRMLQKLASREDLPFDSVSDIARYLIAIGTYKLTELVHDPDLVLVMGKIKLIYDQAMEEKVKAQWAELVMAVRANVVSAMADLDYDAVYDTLHNAINMVMVMKSSVWQARLGRILAREAPVQAAIMWLWLHWGEQSEDVVLKERARELFNWVEEASQ